MKKFLAAFVLLLFAGGIYLAFFGGLQQVTEYRVKTALMDAGVGEKRADCMAQRMTKRLTISQLRKLETLRSETGEKLNVGEYIKRVRKLGDTEVVTVTVSSAGLCAIGIG